MSNTDPAKKKPKKSGMNQGAHEALVCEIYQAQTTKARYTFL